MNRKLDTWSVLPRDTASVALAAAREDLLPSARFMGSARFQVKAAEIDFTRSRVSTTRSKGLRPALATRDRPAPCPPAISRAGDPPPRSKTWWRRARPPAAPPPPQLWLWHSLEMSVRFKQLV